MGGRRKARIAASRAATRAENGGPPRRWIATPDELARLAAGLLTGGA
jgi:hypothetical protein